MRMTDVFVFAVVFAVSDIEEDELAALGELPADSTRDFDRSLFCFWRNLGSFEPWGVGGGDVEVDDCLDGLLLDIAEEWGVVAVVVVVIVVVQE